MSTVELHIRTGAPVECVDGRVGTVGRLETDPAGNLSAMHVETERGTLLVPEGAIRDVRPDGTVLLACSRGDLRPVPRAAETRGPAARPAETLSLREEQLVAHKTMEQVGEVVVRTEVEEVPG